MLILIALFVLVLLIIFIECKKRIVNESVPYVVCSLIVPNVLNAILPAKLNSFL